MPDVSAKELTTLWIQVRGLAIPLGFDGKAYFDKKAQTNIETVTAKTEAMRLLAAEPEKTTKAAVKKEVDVLGKALKDVQANHKAFQDELAATRESIAAVYKDKAKKLELANVGLSKSMKITVDDVKAYNTTLTRDVKK